MGWRELTLDLGQAFLDLLRSEFRALVDDLGQTGRSGVKVLVLLVVAAMWFFWAVGLLTFGLVMVLALAMEIWQAALLLFAVFAVVGAGLAFWAVTIFKRLEPPNRTVGRHVEDHLAWWQDRLLGRPQIEEDWPEALEGGEGSGDDPLRAP